MGVDLGWQSGDHYLAFVPRSTAGPNWLPFSFGGKSLERTIGQRLDGVLSRNLAFDVKAEEGRAADQTQTFRCEGAGVRVSFQAKEIAGELCRVKPAVFQTRNEICVFHGYLSNLDDLLDTLTKSGRAKCTLGNPAVSGGAAQDGGLAAELLLHLYRSTRSSDLLIMLSELQGVYSFFIYDSNRRSVFAARDPSGREPLYYAMDEDEALSFTNKPFNVPGGERFEDWQEVPPGHFIAGKSARLQQFALTPEQLYQREVYESHMDDEGSPPPASPMSPGRMPENSSLSSVHSNFDSDALFRISLDM
jgi:glutamine phosphoribosylpyrophosphate amidotransferase